MILETGDVSRIFHQQIASCWPLFYYSANTSPLVATLLAVAVFDNDLKSSTSSLNFPLISAFSCDNLGFTRRRQVDHQLVAIIVIVIVIVPVRADVQTVL